MDPKFIVFCDGGLCNRLNALVVALIIGRAFRRLVVVHWPLNNWCSLPIEDILELDKQVIVDRGSFSAVENIYSSYVLVAHEQQNFRSPVRLNPNKVHEWRCLLGFFEKTLPTSNTIYFNSIIPRCIPQKLIQGAVSGLRWKEQFTSRAEEFLRLSGLQPGMYWGLHLRGTDFGHSRNYFRFWLAVTHLLPGRKLLCTDDPDVAQMFIGVPGMVRRQVFSHPVKLHPEKNWNDVIIDEEGRQFPFNISRTPDSISESIIDLLTLSKARLLYTSKSTFLNFALLMGGSNLDPVSKAYLEVKRWRELAKLFLRFYLRRAK